MSAGFEGDDTCFSVKLPPWHGLGVVLEDNPSPAEAIKLAGLDWEVEARPVFHATPDSDDGEEYGEIEGYKAITRVTDGRVFAVMTDSYEVWQNRDAFEWVTPLVENGMLKLETAGSLGDGKRIWILAGVVGAEEEVRPGDVVKQNVLLATSHDGSMSVWNGFCATRVVCSNTLRMASEEGTLNRIRHGKAMKLRLDIARDVIAANIDRFRVGIGRARIMAERQVDADLLVGYINSVFRHETAEQLQKRVDLIMPLFEEGRGNGEGSLWDLYNAVTEWLNYNRGKNADSRLNSLWFGEGAKISDRAWGEAVKLVGEMIDDGDAPEV